MKKVFFVLFFLLGMGSVYAQDAEWNTFVNNFKNSNMVSKFRQNIGTVEINCSSNALEIISKGQHVTKIEYSDGIIYFSSNVRDNTIFIDDYWITNLINSYAKTKKYDEDKLNLYIDNNKNLSLQKNGVEYTKKEVRVDTEDSHSSLETYSTIKMNVRDGIPKFNKENSVENNFNNDVNPNTGNKEITSILILLFLVVLSYLNLKKYSKFPLI